MNKKLLFGLIPALLVLSACGGARPGAETFIEDTLLHEELFGGLDTPIKSVRNLESVKQKEPRIGVQYTPIVDGKVSVRYVAAVSIPEEELASYSAAWTRMVYNADGSQRLASGTVSCSSVFTSLNAGGDKTVVPSDFGEGYNYFVVYTLRNIPSSELGGALLASLTVDDGEGGVAPVSSNYITTTLNTDENAVSIALTAEDLAVDGYFLSGTIEGKRATITSDYSLKGNNDFATYRVSLNENDSFVFGYNNLTSNQFKIFHFDNEHMNSNFTDNFEIVDGKMTPKNAGLYRIPFSKDNGGTLYSAKENINVWLDVPEWGGEPADSDYFKYDNALKVYCLETSFNKNDEFVIRDSRYSDGYGGWGAVNKMVWPNCGFTNSWNTIVSQTGEYTIYYYPNEVKDSGNPIGLVGKDEIATAPRPITPNLDIYLRTGAYYEDANWENTDYNKKLISSNENGYAYELTITLGNGDLVKASSDDWAYYWEWDGFFVNNTFVTTVDNGDTPIVPKKDDNQAFTYVYNHSGAHEGTGNHSDWPIKCLYSGTYKFMIRNDGKLEIRALSYSE